MVCFLKKPLSRNLKTRVTVGSKLFSANHSRPAVTGPPATKPRPKKPMLKATFFMPPSCSSFSKCADKALEYFNETSSTNLALAWRVGKVVLGALQSARTAD